MIIRTEFPYETTREDVRIPLPDGVELYARIWRPVTDEPVPALLEYLPYRLTDWTAPRDWQRHPWYAGHGYASVRVDVRGHGCSGGAPGDEYDARELADGVAVVQWLAAQPWCTGSVGMFGISWGGLNSLQIAALAPRALKAVVTVCSTDDRYDNDVHYMGGSVLAVGTHAWAAAMLAFSARPPDPLFVGDGWRDQWLARLESVEPLIHTWLSHQTRDGYWRHGSVCEDYGAIGAAVLAVGGWHDPYRDTVLRLVSALPSDRVRGIIGPWSHQYPDRDRPPGPAIGFLQETLRWWDHWLKGVENGVMGEPLLRSWISESHPPATVYERMEGRWVGDSAWPSASVIPVSYGLQGPPVAVASPQHTGLDAGRLSPFGNDADLPPDQRAEDAKSACFEFPVGDEAVRILGRPRVTARLRMDVPYGQIIARLCDVAPDGSSTLVTRGALNLSARRGRERAVPWPVGSHEEVTFELSGIGHSFPPGHRIRLALSSAYWPWIWPRAGSEAGWTLDPAGSTLELPVRAGGPSEPGIVFEAPEQSEPLGVVHPATLDEPRPERLVVRDVARGVWRLEVDPRYGGTRVYPDGLEFTEDAVEVYEIQEADPLSARTRSEWRIRLHRPELTWDARVETRSEISCDEGGFLTSNEVVCREGDEIVFHRTWERRLPRAAC
ncbi:MULTISPECIES: CocE/NonD family hydrolase [unclassified Streptomyces]|uniref:CocE/NonD family hydrolase n=1 Tax=unclassified Streptomyces TaxID=2593676 RepID=UPI001BE4FB98|nr:MULTISPECIES: CocE/NonD family hydrolase [unclassified Streptomyces]MBT2406663.1 CocE/NonD family hydrolase [Streptomyces sp. ISL-21]MBT2457301.1 CocE/NonD family hydrolase [Streptomyces sp. ISL-86]MBT2613677.1 CocE/NonD family hydrolase [Streptomyces sp. ISL-87]